MHEARRARASGTPVPSRFFEVRKVQDVQILGGKTGRADTALQGPSRVHQVRLPRSVQVAPPSATTGMQS